MVTFTLADDVSDAACEAACAASDVYFNLFTAVVRKAAGVLTEDAADVVHNVACIAGAVHYDAYAAMRAAIKDDGAPVENVWFAAHEAVSIYHRVYDANRATGASADSAAKTARDAAAAAAKVYCEVYREIYRVAMVNGAPTTEAADTATQAGVVYLNAFTAAVPKAVVALTEDAANVVHNVACIAGTVYCDAYAGMQAAIKGNGVSVRGTRDAAHHVRYAVDAAREAVAVYCTVYATSKATGASADVAAKAARDYAMNVSAACRCLFGNADAASRTRYVGIMNLIYAIAGRYITVFGPKVGTTFFCLVFNFAEVINKRFLLYMCLLLIGQSSISCINSLAKRWCTASVGRYNCMPGVIDFTGVSVRK
jgi:hypothetical protein